MKRNVSYYEKEEYLLFINSFDDNDKYKILFETTANTGMRSGEIRALKVKDFDMVNKGLNIDKQITNKLGTGKREQLSYTKTNKSRFEVLPSDVYDKLLQHVLQYDLKLNNFLFFGQDKDSPMSENAIRQKKKNSLSTSRCQRD